MDLVDPRNRREGVVWGEVRFQGIPGFLGIPPGICLV